MTKVSETVCVVGAGIVGLCCAISLQRAGFQVTLVDRDDPGRGCSYGNAGILASCDRGPIGLPGVFGNLPKWLADPLGPLSVRIGHLPRMIPWGFALMKASKPREVERIARHIGEFFDSSVSRHKALLKSVGAADLLRENGYLCVYRNCDNARCDDFFWELHQRDGILIQQLGGDDLRQMVPALNRTFEHAVFVPNEGRILDPYAVSRAVFDAFIADGGSFRREAVTDIIPKEGGGEVVHSGSRHRFDSVVIAAGVWSRTLAERLGSRVLMESMRGYHTMLPHPGIDLGLPVLSGEHKFFASPLNTGLRLAGTAEFAGLDAPPYMRRADVLVGAAKKLFPDLCTQSSEGWMGHRPMTPDSLPVVGPSPHHEGIWFAFGHGHHGLAGAPMTGHLIAELLAGKQPSISLEPYSIERFSR